MGKVVNPVLSAASVVQGKNQSGHVVGAWSMSMPTIKVKIDAGRLGTLEKHTNLDTSATSCRRPTTRTSLGLGAQVALQSSWHPLEPYMFNKGHLVVITMMRGITLRIGCSLYCLDVMVVPHARYNYLTGAPGTLHVCICSEARFLK